MHFDLVSLSSNASAQAIFMVSVDRINEWLAQQPKAWQNWLNHTQQALKVGTVTPLPMTDGQLGGILSIIPDQAVTLSDLAKVRSACPGDMTYQIAYADAPLTDIALAWGMDAYRFIRLKSQHSPQPSPKLALPEDVIAACQATLAATYKIRDWINLPANHLNTTELAESAIEMAKECGAHAKIISGDDLLTQNFPAIHAVGRASTSPPKLIDITWGNPDHPAVVLIGKGVCFDTGGLNLKPGHGMIGMKKDMGGAAHALGVGYWIMTTQQPVHLRILVPTAENAVAGNAMRPSDVIASRKGLSIEVGNTDAEGRLILADALALACEQTPDLIIDFSTLTGAQRIAMGTEIPSFLTNSPEHAKQLKQASLDTQDIVWELPLYQPYKKLLKSKIADLSNISSTPYGGCITAALFLEHFVDHQVPWIHFDFMAANTASRPAHPEGGEAMGLRAVAKLIESRYRQS